MDIGIGGGAFVEKSQCKGWDINPRAVEWLGERLWNKQIIPFMTFWDSIEHMRNPRVVLRLCEDTVFISTPIYESAEHCIRSKHFKPGEHLWYFTDHGLKRFMAQEEFVLLDQTRMEESVGRDGIGTYVFRRV